jgi:hypothetical protein
MALRSLGSRMALDNAIPGRENAVQSCRAARGDHKETTMESITGKNSFVIDTVGDDSAFREFLATSPHGLQFVPEAFSPRTEPALKGDFGDFAKWIKENHSSTTVTIPAGAPRMVLQSGDIWLPLVHLATDTKVHAFLKMVASYLYERLKGALKSDRRHIHMSAMYHDEIAGVTKRLTFEGDIESLEKIIKRFDTD